MLSRWLVFVGRFLEIFHMTNKPDPYSIDVFLEWPKEALIAVSKGFIGNVKIECEDEVKESLDAGRGKVSHASRVLSQPGFLRK